MIDIIKKILGTLVLLNIIPFCIGTFIALWYEVDLLNNFWIGYVVGIGCDLFIGIIIGMILLIQWCFDL